MTVRSACYRTPSLSSVDTLRLKLLSSDFHQGSEPGRTRQFVAALHTSERVWVPEGLQLWETAAAADTETL